MVVAKELGNPFELLSITRKNQVDFGDVLSGTQRALLGHCRAKTVGSVDRKNAHPFLINSELMGTMNGTLSYSTHGLLEGKQHFETDSEALFHELYHNGLSGLMSKIKKTETYQSGTKWNQDAYALVWYDSRDNTLNMLRNEERPLYYCYSKDRQRLFWSSERGHLFGATDSAVSHEENYLIALPENIHLSWEVPDHGKQFQKPKGVKREGSLVPFEPKKGQSILQGYHGNSQNRSNSGSNSTRVTDSSSTRRDDYDNWHDPFTGMYQKWNQAKYSYKWAIKKEGPYFESKQEAWDTLTIDERHERIKAGKYPSDVALWDNIKTDDKRNSSALNDSLNGLNGVAEEKRGSINHHSSGEHSNDDYVPGDNGHATERSEVSEAAESRARLSAKETFKNAAMEKRWNQGNYDVTGLLIVYQHPGVKVYWNPKERNWVSYVFAGFQTPQHDSYIKQVADLCPTYVPFETLDVNARHCFRHVGKKKKKQIYFRGFQGKDLSPKDFNEIMKEGCINCGREPQWGNYVRFVDDKIFFCAHCERDTELVKSFRTGTKQ